MDDGRTLPSISALSLSGEHGEALWAPGRASGRSACYWRRRSSAVAPSVVLCTFVKILRAVSASQETDHGSSSGAKCDPSGAQSSDTEIVASRHAFPPYSELVRLSSQASSAAPRMAEGLPRKGVKGDRDAYVTTHPATRSLFGSALDIAEAEKPSPGAPDSDTSAMEDTSTRNERLDASRRPSKSDAWARETAARPTWHSSMLPDRVVLSFIDEGVGTGVFPQTSGAMPPASGNFSCHGLCP